MRNLIIFGLFVIALVMVQFAQAQTVDEVIDKYMTAMGGKEKLLSLTSVRSSGSLNIQGTDVSITTTRKHMVGMRADISVMGTENYQLVTPTKGWSFMPIQGQSAPEEMSDEVFKASQNQLDVQGPLVNYKEKGNAVELAGKETTDGIECYKLKITYKNGVKVDYYISTKDNRIYKTSSKMAINGEEMEVSNVYTNYKQNADGFWFAYTMTSQRGETNYDKFETNITVDDGIFKN